MAVCFLVGLFLKFYFVKPYMRIIYDGVLFRNLPDTLNLRDKHIAYLEKVHVRKLCWGVHTLFIIGVALVVSGTITFVLGRFGTVLHGSWSAVKYTILFPIRLAKWVLRGIFLRLRRGVRLADRVGRATGGRVTKSGTLLLAFAKLYGRTLLKLFKSSLVFVIDLVKLLLLTAVAALVAAVLYFLYAVISGLIFDDLPSEGPTATQGDHRSSKDAPSSKTSNTPPPEDNLLNGELHTGNEKRNKQRRKKPKESVGTP